MTGLRFFAQPLPTWAVDFSVLVASRNSHLAQLDSDVLAVPTHGVSFLVPGVVSRLYSLSVAFADS